MLVGNAMFVPPAYELIESAILPSAQSSITFNNLETYASTYKHLQLRGVAKDSFTGGAQGDFYLTFNGAGANYRDHWLLGNGSTVIAGSFGYTSVIAQNDILSSTSGLGNMFSAWVIDILDPYSTTKNTTTRTLAGYSGQSSGRVRLSSGAYFVTDPITSINLRSNTNLVAGTRFSLYGIRG
jgi:hypothetical protein